MLFRTLSRFAFFFAALVVMAMANLPDPPQPPGDLTDKQQHMLAFAVLTLLARTAWPDAAIWKIFLSLCIFGALIELAQAAAGTGRDPSAADWLADIVAIGLILAAATMVRLFTRKVVNAANSSGPD